MNKLQNSRSSTARLFYLKICAVLTAGSLLLPVVPVSAEKNETVQLFVASDATDGDGTISSPYKTLTEARDHIRNLKENGEYPSGGVTVNIRGGKYFMTEGVKLDERDSGTKDAPVTWRAYGNENVELIGGVSMDLSEFTKVDDKNIIKKLPKESADKIYQVDLKKYGFTRFDELPQTGHSTAYLRFIEAPYNDVDSLELFFNDEVMTLSRWPNDGFVRIEQLVERGEYAYDFLKGEGKNEETWKPAPYKPSKFTVDAMATERMERWKDADDIWCFGYWKYDWSDLTVGVKINNDDSSVTNRHTLAMEPKSGQRIYFYNLIEELDIPGEWFLDRKSGILYFYPPESKGQIMLSVLSDPVFELDGTEYVDFKALSVKVVRNDGFKLRNCKNTDISLCSVSKTTQYGIETEDCENCRFISNHVYDTGVGGILLQGGNKDTLEPALNIAENNWINNFSRIKTGYSPAIGMYGVGQIARHNKIHGSDHLAMRIVGNDHLVEYNEFFDVLRTAADMGVIYMYREKDRRGTIIRNNYFHDIGSEGSLASHGIQGIYYDEMADAVTAENNLFVNFAGDCVFVNGGRDHVIKNNVFLNCGGGVKISAIGMNPAYGYDKDGKFESIYHELYEEGNHKKKPFSKYVHLPEILEDDPKEPKYNLVENNVTIGCGYDFKWTEIGKEKWAQLYEQNSIKEGLVTDSTANIGFENPEKGNYNIAGDSEIYKKLNGFEAPDFANMGMYTPQLAHKLKGTVSLAPYSPIVYTDFEPGYVDPENLMLTPVIENDLTYVPVRFIAEALGGTATFDENTRVAGIQLGSKTVSVNIDDGTVKQNEDIIKDVSFINRENRILLPLRAVAELFDKTVEWYPQGIIIIGDEKVLQQDETQLIEELKRRLM